MDRNYGLIAVLCAILLLNIIAIVLLSDKNAQEPPLPPAPQQDIMRAPPNDEEDTRPLVRTLILQDPSCPQCYDIREYANQLEGVVAMDVQDAPFAPFAPARLPALAFNATIEQYPLEFTQGWETYGSIVTIASGEYAGTWYVLPTLTPLYVETATGRVRGIVTVTYLDLASCEECFDPTETRTALAEARIAPMDERTLDAESQEGKALIAAYNITRVPTIILTGDMDAYPSLRPGWEAVGTIEQDGAYVLRDLQRLRVTYYDLQREDVMIP